MLLNEIKVPPEELERISKNFHHAGIEAKMKHENLKKDIDMLYNSWYGLSSQNFFIAFNLSRGILDTYVDKLEYIEKKLAQIAEKFRNTDESYIFEESSNLLKTSKDYIESGLYGDTLTYEVTGEIPKNFDSIPSKLLAGEQIGGEAKGAVIDSGYKFSDESTLHEKLVSGEAKLAVEQGKFEASADASLIDFSYDSEQGRVSTEFLHGEAKAEIGAGGGEIAAKIDGAKVEGEFKIPIWGNWEITVGGDASYGSLGIAAGGKVSNSGGEAHGSLGVGPFGLGFKLGVNKHN